MTSGSPANDSWHNLPFPDRFVQAFGSCYLRTGSARSLFAFAEALGVDVDDLIRGGQAANP